LDAHEVVDPIDGHGLNNLITVEFSDGLGALLARLLGLLDGDKLVAVQGDAGGHLTTVGSGLLELLTNLERTKKIYRMQDLKTTVIKSMPSKRGF